MSSSEQRIERARSRILSTVMIVSGSTTASGAVTSTALNIERASRRLPRSLGNSSVPPHHPREREQTHLKRNKCCALAIPMYRTFRNTTPVKPTLQHLSYPIPLQSHLRNTLQRIQLAPITSCSARMKLFAFCLGMPRSVLDTTSVAGRPSKP